MKRIHHLLALSTSLCVLPACGSDEDPKEQETQGDASNNSETPDKSNPSQDTPTNSPSPEGDPSSTSGGDPDQSSDDDTGSQDNTDSEPDSGGGSPETAKEVCERYQAAFSSKDEGQWSGNVDGCEPGDISKEARDRALAQVNFIRWLTGLKSVTTDPALDKKAQACALIMHANGQLSHNPPSSWKCYSAEGADAAKKSNISSAPGVSSVLLYMIDPGNDTTIGHRRWIVANRFGPTGLGSTSKSSCMFTIGGKQNGDREWTAWPPPGVFPIELNSNGWASMDKTGWTIQSDSIAFDGKSIKVKANGEDQSVDIAQLLPNFGARNAVKITPKGWKMSAGTKYQVTVEGTDIDFEFEAVSCK